MSVYGGFFGAVTNDLKIHNEIPRSAILCARILWTYASAYRRYGDEKYLSMATHAYDTLRKTFWDPQYGGVYWTVDAEGAPAVPSRRTGSLGPNGVLDRKHHYAQAFAIYGLAEYYKATQDRGSLTMAQDLFRLLEQHPREVTLVAELKYPRSPGDHRFLDFIDPEDYRGQRLSRLDCLAEVLFRFADELLLAG